jgi:membrane fusion protein (multidrug efflux system)
MTRRNLTSSAILLAIVIGGGVLLAVWKYGAIQAASAAAASQPEPMESVMVAEAKPRQHTPATTAIGTVIALRSITLRNELAGTVRKVNLEPGRIVEPGTVLVGLDVAVEEADLASEEAQAHLAEVNLGRTQRMVEQRAMSAMELDQAVAQRDVARAQVARTKDVIERKTIRAPFRARLGISDVHPGQYLNEGTQLTTLQGLDDDVYIDFTVAQRVATQLRHGGHVDVLAGGDKPVDATILAIVARVDPATRNATVRARVDHAQAFVPGASVRVRVPIGAAEAAVSIPVNALRKDPAGDHVFVLAQDKEGKTRAHQRPVRAGEVLGDEIIIEDGLVAGEKVAVSGSFKLRDAVLVAVANERPAPETSASAAPGTTDAKL